MVPLSAILYASDDKGKRLHGGEDVAYALPLLVYTLQMDPGQLPPEVQRDFLRGCELCGLSGGESAQQLAKKVGEAYAKKPVARALTEALDAWARTGLLDHKTPDTDKARLAAFLGANRSAGVLDSGERPSGTIAAGPLARFASAEASDPKKK